MPLPYFTEPDFDVPWVSSFFNMGTISPMIPLRSPLCCGLDAASSPPFYGRDRATFRPQPNKEDTGKVSGEQRP